MKLTFTLTLEIKRSAQQKKSPAPQALKAPTAQSNSNTNIIIKQK